MQRMRKAPLPEPHEVMQAAVDASKVAQSMRTGDAERDAATAESVNAADDAIIASDPRLAYDCLHASRMIESAAQNVMGDNKELGNKFLVALAAGADAHWPEQDGAAIKARRLRQELMAVLDADGHRGATNALLRMVSRDGRLWPGLAPEVAGDDYINSEKGALTPLSEVAAWFSGERPDQR